MRKLHILGITLALVILLVLAACVPFPFGPPGYQQPFGTGGGMMGGGPGSGMMGGGGPRGGTTGGNWNSPNSSVKLLTIEQAADAVRRYLSTYGGNLVLAEVMEFSQNFYAEVEEKDTGIHATEMLVDKYTGQVYPEYGPNMMWNTKYGMMSRMMGNSYGGQPTADMPVTPKQAEDMAQKWLGVNLPGVGVAEADAFYGYYTLHTLKSGQLEGMLSINGYTGAVWYHSWHGPFIGMKEFE